MNSVSGRDELTLTAGGSLTVTGTVNVSGGVALLSGGTLSKAHVSAGTTVLVGNGTIDRAVVDGAKASTRESRLLRG